MSLLYRVLFSWKCTSTHHKLAMDALRHLQCDSQTLWFNLFLKNIEAYLDGSKAPDKKFKDFRNHVLHVQDNHWGGAVKSAELWYERTLQCLKAWEWQKAVYCAGVLSHYYTDPIQPLHTAQSEAEGKIHRACEWSIAKSYETLQQRLEDLGGYPEVEVPTGANWLAGMVTEGAELANPYYETLVDGYDLDAGVKDPPAGLNEELSDCLALLIGHAAVGFSRILDRLFEDANVDPPKVSVKLEQFLTTLTIPIFWVTKNMADRAEKAQVQAMYKELQQTGQVQETLPEDDRTVRYLYETEVVAPRKEAAAPSPKPSRKKKRKGKSQQKKQVTAKPVASTEEPQTRQEDVVPLTAEKNLRFYLDMDKPVEDAPSIGAKTAARLESIGVTTVGDLLAQDPETASAVLNVRYITPEVLRIWQVQARLVCRIPRLRGHDAQILVGSGIETPETLAEYEPSELLNTIQPFLETKDGQFAVRSGKKPDLEEVTQWIIWAGLARELKAA